MIFTNPLINNLVEVVVIVVVIIIHYFKWQQTYWLRKKLQYIEPQIPWGNLPNPLQKREAFGISIKDLYQTMKKREWRHGGIYVFSTPQYIPVDLDLIKQILTKDFGNFTDHGIYYNEKEDPLSAHLFALGGEKWKRLRSKLSSSFTAGKMKTMFQTLLDCENNLQDRIRRECQQNRPINTRELLACFTTDVIGSCAFGLECNTFKDDDSPFRKYGKQVFQEDALRQLRTTFLMNFSDVGKKLGMRLLPKDMTNFFRSVVKDTVDYRKDNNITRNDFLQLLIDLKNNNQLTIDEVAAQSFVFFVGGFDTASITMTFALFELAKNQEIQDKVRKEINDILGEDKITYEGITKMKYMQQIIDETLRKYPPVPFIPRVCVKDYKIPGENIVLEKGQRVAISVLGIHHDEEYYPDPEKFDPERFSVENSKLRHSYAYIPFGLGPRICIGMRFGLMQTKIGLASLLRRYKFQFNDKTCDPIPFQANFVVLAPEGEVLLDAVPLA